MVKKLFETAFDCNDCNSDYPLCNRTAWINHRLAMMLFAGFMPFIVMTGMHWAFVPASMLGISGVGYDLM